MNRHSTKHAALKALVLATLGLTAISAFAQYPTKQVKIIVPSAAGSAPDIMARALGSELQTRLGQPFIAENIAGAGGSIGSDRAAKSPADGYTLVMGTPANKEILADAMTGRQEF